MVSSSVFPLQIDSVANGGRLGWWLCMNMTTSVQGWTPQSYLEEQVAPVHKSTPPPPPPAGPRVVSNPVTNGAATAAATAAAAKAKPAPPVPSKRPNVAGRKPAPPAAPRDSAVSMNSHDSSGASGRGTPSSVSNMSLAGGLAEALRQRQQAMHGKEEDDDEW